MSESQAPTCTICGKVSTGRDIDGDWWPPCEHAARVGLHTLAYPAAPLSTLPERPVSRDDLRLIHDAIFGRIPLRDAFPALDNVNVAMLGNEEEIESLRSRLSSLERELDGVRKERDQWKGRAEWLWQAPFADAPHRDRDGRAWFRETPDVVYEDVWTAIDAAISALRERSK